MHEAFAVTGLRRTVTTDLGRLDSERETVRQWLDQRGHIDAVRLHDIVLVFTELLANAIEAAPQSPTVEYRLELGSNSVTVRVLNHNDAQTPIDFRTMPGPFALEGRGLALAMHYADHLEIHSAGDLVDITAEFHRSRRRHGDDPQPDS